MLWGGNAGVIGNSGVVLAALAFSERTDRAGRRRAYSVGGAAGGLAAVGPPEIPVTSGADWR
jgi:hypothetical protein